MPFQQPITIHRALQRIEKNEFVLPAIQREFVWETEQIGRLFDSLMRGYPFGSFLFWRVEKESTQEYAFYQFVTNYHKRDAPHCPPISLSGSDAVTAVLDGQQRLTALNIGLRGSHAEKLPRKRWSNPHAFPKKQLYLDILSESHDDELDMKYEFEFLTDKRAKAESAEARRHWFPVSKIRTMDAGPDLHAYLVDHGLIGTKAPFKTLHRLHAVIHTDGLITYFEEEEQNLDKVLNIFIRVNSGGTILSYADLLLSVATAQWKERDAREEIHSLVDDLNKTGLGFRFPKDLVLKAALMLTDIPEVQFKVTNFTADNMAKIERRWDEIERALQIAASLLASFGFSDQNLTANNVILPVSYYVMARGLGESFLTGRSSSEDRERIRLWVVRTLVKRGVWGSGLDTLLKAIRGAMRRAIDGGATQFPTEAIEAAMRERGKHLRFDEEELDALLETRYQDRGTFALLSLLYPGADLRAELHIDHVFPRSLLRVARLKKAEVEEAHHGEISGLKDMLPNLQLMDGSLNVQKSDKLPKTWLASVHHTDTDQGYYLAKHDLGTLPADATEFLDFFSARRERMKEKLRAKLGV
ncbi:DUF262 domain-containing protein [Enhygromyxa salina]|uniref:GmrSD restriction endonucleases N-terminal domain-containing protein n=1 Tax=Enhygromyxa salina TaxID=215803 RepID=A0A2S9YWT6_9BACT|nr:DUF262 domain-containing protein [Enhygromyxa salina]PRQ09544.1 hypothetical protein ENSA7_07240 [Enhygromyxa salina]